MKVKNLFVVRLQKTQRLHSCDSKKQEELILQVMHHATHSLSTSQANA